MTDREVPIVPYAGDRTVLGCRVSQDVQNQFGEFVTEKYENRKGAFGYCVEEALREYMNNDRYARLEDRMNEVERTVNHTNALVRKIVTAEKEKGVFLEDAPSGNQAGSRKERENAVIREWVNNVIQGNLSEVLSERELNGLIMRVANVTSEPTKRDYRESMVDRGLVTVSYAEYTLTDAAFELAGVTEEWRDAE